MIDDACCFGNGDARGLGGPEGGGAGTDGDGGEKGAMAGKGVAEEEEAGAAGRGGETLGLVVTPPSFAAPASPPNEIANEITAAIAAPEKRLIRGCLPHIVRGVK